MVEKIFGLQYLTEKKKNEGSVKKGILLVHFGTSRKKARKDSQIVYQYMQVLHNKNQEINQTLDNCFRKGHYE